MMISLRQGFQLKCLGGSNKYYQAGISVAILDKDFP